MQVCKATREHLKFATALLSLLSFPPQAFEHEPHLKFSRPSVMSREEKEEDLSRAFLERILSAKNHYDALGFLDTLSRDTRKTQGKQSILNLIPVLTTKVMLTGRLSISYSPFVLKCNAFFHRIPARVEL